MRESKRLTAMGVSKTTKPGRYGDGQGLYLQISKWRTKSWLFRFERDGRERQMGLGSLHTLTLAEAREQARECRKLLLSGVDPIEARRGLRTRAEVETARGITFGECGERYIAAHQSAWKSKVHRAQWASTLSRYVYPVLGQLPVAAVDTGLVLKVLEPIWTEKPETASRIRGRVESVLDWAAARGHRSGENPARWKGHLQKLLPQPSKVARVKHHAALPYAEVPAFMVALRNRDGVSARALEFTILTATRTSEAIEARWSEIDLVSCTWTLPAERMKAGREHRIPLSDQALTILEKLPREAEFVFVGAKPGRPLSNMALLAMLKRMGRPDLTAHGFRSTFRDWAAECTSYPSEVVGMALAHTIKNKAEAAYRRGDLFDKRHLLMAEWAQYCASLQSTSTVP
jgi:integrase